MTKVADSYNMYRLELSLGEIKAVKDAVEKTETVDAIIDDFAAALDWSLENVPGAGETKEEFKARKEGGYESPAKAADKKDEPGTGGNEEIPSFEDFSKGLSGSGKDGTGTGADYDFLTKGPGDEALVPPPDNA